VKVVVVTAGTGRRARRVRGAKVDQVAVVRGGPGGRPRGKRQLFSAKKKVCKFLRRKRWTSSTISAAGHSFPQFRAGSAGRFLPRRMTGVCARHQRLAGRGHQAGRATSLSLPFAGSGRGHSSTARGCFREAPAHAAPAACNSNAGSGYSGAASGPKRRRHKPLRG